MYLVLICFFPSVILLAGVSGFNLDPSSPTLVFSSGSGDEELFGFSVAQHRTIDGEHS